MVLGVGSAAGLVQAYAGLPEVVTGVLFPVFSILLAMWVPVRVLLLRKTSAAS